MDGSNFPDDQKTVDGQSGHVARHLESQVAGSAPPAGAEGSYSIMDALRAGHNISRSVSAVPPEMVSELQETSKQDVSSTRLGRSTSLKETKTSTPRASDTGLQPQSPSSMAFQAQVHPALHPEHSPHLDKNPPSASSSPGVFTPISSPLRPNFPQSDAPEPYSSPYLYYTHGQEPKETHFAEVERDPISGRKMINHYEIISELGRGVHGKVKLGRNLHTGQKVAIKIVERVSKRRRLGRTGDQEVKIKREIAILKKARHPNIVGLLEVIDDPAKRKVYIVLEFAELGEVEWRTRGEDQICLVESRRNQRETQGIFENDTENQHDEHILETARRHLERREELEGEQTQRVSIEMPASSVRLGDSEHGADADTEAPAPPVYRQGSRKAAFILGSWDDTDSLPDLLDHSSQAHPLESIEAHQAALPGQLVDTYSLDPARGLPSSHDRSNSEFDRYPTSLAESMHGAHDTTLHDRERGLHHSFAFFGDNYLHERISEHYRYVPTMTLSEARRTIRDTVLGLEYLHYQGVVHRDIKPANLLQTRDHRIKISDFGVSYSGKTVNAQGYDDQSESEAPDFDEALELAKTVGTPAFYAPELCSTDVDDDDPLPVTNAIDVWALGVTLYCLVFGRLPFHDNNTFALMRRIASQDVYIPRKRLKAVDLPRESADPFSPPEKKQVSDGYRRHPHNLEHEDVSDELFDLLKRLLIKDPRKRIKLTEVKHHPWLLSGIQDPGRWIDESDPSRITDGKKIEVSKEDVDVAVVPVNLSDHLLNMATRAAKKITGAFGIGKGQSRRRAKSAADTTLSSNASSSSTISQDAKRYEQQKPNSRPDEVMISAPKTSRETEHPLSQSVTASPETKEYSPYFGSFKESDSMTQGVETIDDGLSERPSTLERGFSTADSVRTIRQSDIAAITGSIALKPASFPSSPQPLNHDRTSITGIFGGAKRKIFRGINSREPDRSRGRTLSSDLFSSANEHSHSEPSIAFSNTIAAGVVNPPASLQDDGLSSAAASPISSGAPSLGGHPDLIRMKEASEGLSRQSSLSSVASRGRLGHVESRKAQLKPQFLPLLAGTTHEPAAMRQSPALDTAEGQLVRAKEEQFRRLIQEEQQHRRSPISEQLASPLASQAACPPSPDDFLFARRQSEAAIRPDESLNLGPSVVDFSPADESQIITRPSDDQFTSGMSQSTSNPSLPSAYSANSSVMADDIAPYSVEASKHSFGSEHNQSSAVVQIHQASDGENQPADASDKDNDDYSSDESFIEMASKKKPKATGRHGRSTSHPVTPSTRLHSQYAPFAITERRGSANNMKYTDNYPAEHKETNT